MMQHLLKDVSGEKINRKGRNNLKMMRLRKMTPRVRVTPLTFDL
jgi:hypothetical protein